MPELSRRRSAATAVVPALALALAGVALGPAGATPAAAGLSAVTGSGDGQASTTPLAVDAPVVVHPSRLRVGPAARVPWLVDNVLHTATGHTTTMPWSRVGARTHLLRLLGHTSGGWAVKSFDGGNRWMLWLVEHGERRLIQVSAVSEGESVDYRASRDQQHLLIRYFDGDRASTLTALDLDGAVLDSEDFDGIGEVLDFTGPELVVGTTDTRRWDIAAQTVTPVGGDAAGAELARDLLFATDPDTSESGPTSLDAPAEPAWTAPMAQPVVSPDGRRVASRDERGGHLLTVRNLATGATRVTFDVRYLAAETPRWESDNTLVFVAAVNGLGDEEALVRCRLSGDCRRISPVMPRDTISLIPR